MKKKAWHWALVLFACSSLASVPVAAEIICSTGDYRGTYAFYATGALVTLPPEAAALAGPFAQAGTFTADGLGNVIIESTPSYNGFVLPTAEVGTYTVTPDCTLRFDLVLPILNVPSTFFGTLGLNNRHYTLTVLEPTGTVITGQHFKQDFRFCGTDDFSGAYQVDLSGGVVPPLPSAGQFYRTGRLLADGEGRFTAETVANYAGSPVTESLAGTYTVSARCGIELRYSHGGQDILITGNLGGRGDIVPVTVATPGWAVAGVLRSQQ